ncbi:thioesterase domain-containing protein [Saccharomonospora xinjiangensis]|uniref:thioesterase II family protein n=1 Tax=Saccharomonospora xinjiangensis TaxID=75294 RepID=UPI00106F29F3|nr:thioesterase domain-containing protein [Saccharomonospora xinjiangensis]QBQ59924.1 Thioesterase domain protein [Saccharomonospora xinjiangensis]
MIIGFPRRSGARARLVCFPGSESPEEFHRAASRMMAPEVEVLAVRFPHDALAEGDVRALAVHALPSVRSLTGLPLRLFGHGPGAFVAFEVARLLEAKGGVLEGLIMACDDAQPPCGETGHKGRIRRRPNPPLGHYDLAYLRWFAQETANPETTLTCPILALIGDDDPGTSIERMSVLRQRTSGEFVLEVFGGGPGFLESCAATVVTTIRDRIIPPPT